MRHLLTTIVFATLLSAPLHGADATPVEAKMDSAGTVLYKPGAYPRVIKLANGNVLAAVNTWWNDGTNRWGVRFVKSTDSGQTFSFLSQFRDAAETQTLACETIFEVSPGNLLLAYNIYDQSNKALGQKLKVQRSKDNGVTWSPVAVLENGSWNWEPEFSIAADGSLQLFYSYAGTTMSTDAQQIVRRESTDGGATWGPIVPVKGRIGISNPLNCGMPKLPAKSL